MPLQVIMQIGGWKREAMPTRYIGKYDESELEELPTAGLRLPRPLDRGPAFLLDSTRFDVACTAPIFGSGRRESSPRRTTTSGA